MKIVIEQHCNLPKGFSSSGIHAGIKANKKDMALFYADTPCSIAGVFTKNQLKAAPVIFDQAQLAGGKSQAVIMNSGNANAATGKQGMLDSEEMAQQTATALNIDSSLVMVSSTGGIGKFLDMDKINKGISLAANAQNPGSAMDAAEAMMTTDTVPKFGSVTISLPEGDIQLCGIAKGAGMIEPNMATMLCYLFTDASISSPLLQESLSNANQQSFNRITIDGDMSTNDTVLLMANASSGININQENVTPFQEALNALTLHLAKLIVKDGEGATKFITLHIHEASTAEDAEKIARAIGNSLLVKTGMAGSYPFWSRILDAIGYAGPTINPDSIGIKFNDLAS